MINILEQITKHRESRGWTEYHLAERSELPQSTISSWYKKQMLPSLSSLEKICNAFDLSMSQFFADSTEPFPLTEEQRDFIDKWSQLPKEKKEVVVQLVQIM